MVSATQYARLYDGITTLTRSAVMADIPYPTAAAAARSDVPRSFAPSSDEPRVAAGYRSQASRSPPEPRRAHRDLHRDRAAPNTGRGPEPRTPRAPCMGRKV